MSYYRTCPLCSSNLDPGELCACGTEKGPPPLPRETAQPKRFCKSISQEDEEIKPLVEEGAEHMDNKRFYFTYGMEGQPFRGGWTVVLAPDRGTACALFRIVHPDQIEGLLNCSSVYDEIAFQATSMDGPSGNFGAHCWEVVELRHTVAARA